MTWQGNTEYTNTTQSPRLFAAPRGSQVMRDANHGGYDLSTTLVPTASRPPEARVAFERRLLDSADSGMRPTQLLFSEPCNTTHRASKAVSRSL